MSNFHLSLVGAPRRSGLAVAAALALLPASIATADGRDRSGDAEAMSPEWIQAHTCGHLGGACEEPESTLRLRVSPRRAPLGRTTRFRLRVVDVASGSRRPARAVVRIGGRRIVTGRDGRAVVITRLGAAGRRAATARSSSAGRARTWIRVVG